MELKEFANGLARPDPPALTREWRELLECVVIEVYNLRDENERLTQERDDLQEALDDEILSDDSAGLVLD